MDGGAGARVRRYAQAPASIAELEFFADNADFAHAVAANGRPEGRAHAYESEPPEAEIFGRNARYRRGSDGRGVAEPADRAVDHFPSLKALRVIPAPT